MANKTRKNIDPYLLDLKQASLDRMFEQAKVLHQQGELRKVTTPASRVPRKSEPIRVLSSDA